MIPSCQESFRNVLRKDRCNEGVQQQLTLLAAYLSAVAEVRSGTSKEYRPEAGDFESSRLAILADMKIKIVKAV